MPRHLNIRELRSYVDETIAFLLSRLAYDKTVTPTIAGWHNFFKPGRIGTTGSALPLFFLHNQQVDFPDRIAVINQLLVSQENNGAWAILSLGDVPTVEGTAWPMRALSAAGDMRSREAVYKAEQWMLSHQGDSGGWGSTKENSPRALLTAISLESLASLNAPNREAITRGVSWFSHTQRQDGSWGHEPGQDGTVLHTALVIKALLAAGLPSSNPHIVAGSSFLKSRWIPDPNNFQQEIYDVHHLAAYSRVIIEHDVDAAVVRALLPLNLPWAFEPLFDATGAMLDLYARTHTLSPRDVPASIWNIIPRATAFAAVLRHLPVNDGRILSLRGAILLTGNPHFSERKDLLGILIKQVAPQYTLALALMCFFIGITATIGFFYYRGSISGKEVLLSLLANLAALSLGLFIDQKGWIRK